MVKKVFHLRKLVSVQNIIILVIICTILFYITHQSSIYQGKNKFKTEFVKLERGDLFIQDPKNDSTFYLLIQDDKGMEFRVYQYPMELRGIIQYLDTHIRFNNRYMSKVYKTGDRIYVTLLKDKSKVWLLTIDAIKQSYGNQEVYNLDSLYYFLQDSTIVKNNIKFYKHLIYEDADITHTFIQEYKDGYRICFTESFFLELRRYIYFDELEKSKEYRFVTQLLNGSFRTDELFDEYDVYDLIYYFSAIHFHIKKFFENMDKDFLPVRCPILGLNDINMDGYDDVLIQIDGDKFVPKILIVYDVKNSSIIWGKMPYPEIRNMKFFDVDGDGIDEMLCTTYAPCTEMCIGFHNYNAWLLRYSYFFILDNNGDVKKICEKDAVVQSSQGFTEYQSVILEDRSKVLLGLKSNYKSNEKKFITYDYKSGVVDTLEQTYTNILYMEKSGNQIIYYDQNQNALNECVFNEDITKSKLLRSHDFECAINNFYYHVIHLFNKKYNIVKEKNKVSMLIDDRLNILYRFPHDVHDPHIMMHSANNTIYYIDKTESSNMFAKIEFTKNTTLNPFVIILFLSELLILFIFLVLKQILSVPITSTKDNYFVIHSFFGVLYSWRLTGAYSRFFKLPRRVSFHKATAYKFLYDVSDKVQEFYVHSVLFVKTKVYKIHTENELSIIQRISHDLKNQIMMIKLQMDEYYERIKKKQAQEVGSMLETIKEISVVSQTLSSFSHINKLYKEKIGIILLIEEILTELFSHPNIDSIQVETDGEYYIYADKKLLKTALKNLISNALDAIKGGQQIVIIIKQVDHVICIIIKNPTGITQKDFEKVKEIGYTTKKTGSGLGIPIARSIIEKHNGKFQVMLKDHYFIVEIYLPYEHKEKS